ncbi:MAG: thioredoxin family protein [bacterium]|nr:thioredoxin family protein [Candidatus Sumerlaeota bacterium]
MSFTLEIGQQAPPFRLPATDGKEYGLEDFAPAKIVVVVFSCNHCPFVVGSEDRMTAFQRDYAARGARMVAINSNETDNHPTDSFEHMIERARQKGFNFPYLRDEPQDVARAYGALRTPHYFVFDEKRVLRYTGRMDDNPRDAAKAVTRELRDAVDALLAGQPVPQPVTNPIGCNVKWRGKAEHWMPPEACDLA